MTYGAPEMAWPWRILLVVSTVYFLPALVLGMISPTAAKLALRRSKFTGATIGGVYAWGTIGSITGTLTAGFFLIAFIGAPNVLLAAAAVTGLLGLTLGPVRLYHGVWLLFLCAVFVASDLNPIKDGTESAAECLIAEESADESNPKPWRERLTKRLKQKGERWGLRPDISDVVFAMDGNYQYVKVYDKNSTKGTGTIRTLCLDYLIHGYVDLDDPSHLEYDYELVYRDLTRKYMGEKADISAFFMGGGSYTFQRWVLNEWPGANIVVAEIDPLVLKANHNALGLPSDTPIQTRIGDARNVLDDQPNKKIFDLFFADAFNDFSVPWHLTTKEFAESVKRRLKPDGVFLVNIIDDFRFGKFIGATYLTLKEVFPHVYVFCTDQAGVNMRRDTFVVAASETPHDFSAWGPKHSADFNGSLLTQENLDELRKKCENLILTDDHAPVENLLAPMVRTRQ
jgi:spermidine synthase